MRASLGGGLRSPPNSRRGDGAGQGWPSGGSDLASGTNGGGISSDERHARVVVPDASIGDVQRGLDGQTGEIDRCMRAPLGGGLQSPPYSRLVNGAGLGRTSSGSETSSGTCGGVNSLEERHAWALVQSVEGISAASRVNGAVSPYPCGDGMDVEVCLKENSFGISSSGESSLSSLSDRDVHQRACLQQDLHVDDAGTKDMDEVVNADKLNGKVECVNDMQVESTLNYLPSACDNQPSTCTRGVRHNDISYSSVVCGNAQSLFAGGRSAVMNGNDIYNNSNVDGAGGVGSTFIFSSPQDARGKVSTKPMVQKSEPAPKMDKARNHLEYVWQRPPVVSLPSRAELGHFAINGNSVQLDEDVLRKNLKKFDAALVGRLFGKKIPFFQLRSELVRRWERHGQFRLVTITADCFICYFDSIAARDSVLMSGPWVIAGQVLGLDKWSSTFSPSSMDGFVTPVWVRLPELPLYCWDLSNIARIVASLGEPLWIDAATNSMDRGAFARACVKLDLSKPLLAGVWVQSSCGKFYQRVEYEGLSTLCFRCGIVGHKEAACRAPPMARAAHPEDSLAGGVKASDHVLSKEQMEKSMSMDSMQQEMEKRRSKDSMQQEPTDEGLYGPGPWMVVQRRKSPTHKNQLKISNSANKPILKQSEEWKHMGSHVGGKDLQQNSLLPSLHRDLEVGVYSNRESNSSSPPKSNLPPLNSKGDVNLNHTMDMIQVNGTTSSVHGNGEPNPTLELKCSQELVLYDNFGKDNSSTKERMSKSYADRMTNGLGPLVQGDRSKKRKKAAHNGGGDASSLKPP